MFAVVIPVGPDDRDVARLGWLLRELADHESRDEFRLVIIDDAPKRRPLALDWPDREIVVTPLWRRRRPDLHSAQVAGTLEALRRTHGCEFAVKLDTDAAVIGRFSPAIRMAFSDPGLGVVGSYDRMSTGAVRDWSKWKPLIDRADRGMFLFRDGNRPALHRHGRAQRDVVRRTRAQAYRFAPPGAHCLGGAYAVSAAFVQHVSLDWHPWIARRISEDVVVGLLSSAAGLRMRSLTARGDPFALSWQGLPAAPADLVARGHAIVHSTKCDSEHGERDLREQLRALAQGTGSERPRSSVEDA